MRQDVQQHRQGNIFFKYENILYKDIKREILVNSTHGELSTDY